MEKDLQLILDKLIKLDTDLQDMRIEMKVGFKSIHDRLDMIENDSVESVTTILKLNKQKH